MSVPDLYTHDKPVMSFEFFPPKTDAGFRSLFRTIEDLKQLDPGFVSVTMGAGGSTRTKTVELVLRIQQELGITAMAHLPCLGFSAEEVAACCALASASGRRSEPTTAWRTPPPVCPALAECVSSRAPWQHPSPLGDGPATLVSPQRLL